MSSYFSINDFVLIRRLGKGQFGDVWLAERATTGECVAVKYERLDSVAPQLEHEHRVYQILHAGSSVTHAPVGIAQVLCYDRNKRRRHMVMTHLGATLWQLFKQRYQAQPMPPVVVAKIALDCLDVLKFMHTCKVIHCDLKPENMMLEPEEQLVLRIRAKRETTQHARTTSIKRSCYGHRLGQPHAVYVVDFGMTRAFHIPSTEQHTPCSHTNRSFQGTARYASVNTHLGVAPSRRDDLESLAYMLLLLSKGTLPWCGLKEEDMRSRAPATTQRPSMTTTLRAEQTRHLSENDELLRMIAAVRRKKVHTTHQVLCDGVVPELRLFLDHVCNLNHDAEPDYAHCTRLFEELGRREMAKGDDHTLRDDWMLLQPLAEKENVLGDMTAQTHHLASTQHLSPTSSPTQERPNTARTFFDAIPPPRVGSSFHSSALETEEDHYDFEQNGENGQRRANTQSQSLPTDQIMSASFSQPPDCFDGLVLEAPIPPPASFELVNQGDDGVMVPSSVSETVSACDDVVYDSAYKTSCTESFSTARRQTACAHSAKLRSTNNCDISDDTNHGHEDGSDGNVSNGTDGDYEDLDDCEEKEDSTTVTICSRRTNGCTLDKTDVIDSSCDDSDTSEEDSHVISNFKQSVYQTGTTLSAQCSQSKHVHIVLPPPVVTIRARRAVVTPLFD